MIIRLLFYILSILIFINAFVLAYRGSFAFGLIILILLGGGCLVYAQFYHVINAWCSSGLLMWLKIAVLIGATVYLCFMGILLCYSHTNVNYQEDAIIVLGAGVKDGVVSKVLQNRLDACIGYYHKNPQVKIVVSGGPTKQKDTTEGAAMQAYLIGKGIPIESILVEDKARSTKENFLLSKALLEKQGIACEKVAFVTNSFHIYRGKTYAEFAGFKNATAVSTKTDKWTLLPAVIREVLGVIDMWLFQLK